MSRLYAVPLVDFKEKYQAAMSDIVEIVVYGTPDQVGKHEVKKI